MANQPTKNEDAISGDCLQAILEELQSDGVQFTQLAVEVQDELHEFIHVEQPDRRIAEDANAVVEIDMDVPRASTDAAIASTSAASMPPVVGDGARTSTGTASTVPAVRKSKQAASKPVSNILRETLLKSKQPPMDDFDEKRDALRSSIQRIKAEIISAEKKLAEEMAHCDKLQAAQAADDERIKQLDEERKRVKECRNKRKRQLDDCQKRIDTLSMKSEQKRTKLNEEKETVLSFFDV